MTAKTYTLQLPQYRPPTTNQLMRGTLRHRMRLERECRDIVALYWRFEHHPPATGRRRVSIKITLPPRGKESDVDSLWKSTLDALVACGALRGDRLADCELGRLTFERGTVEEWGTQITLTEVE